MLNSTTLAFADLAGNRKLITVGNAAGHDRVAMIPIDYARRRRLRVLGRLRIRDLAEGERRDGSWLAPGYSAKPRRLITIEVAAFDWNCPQHSPELLDAEDVKTTIAALQESVADLERRLSQEMLRSPALPPAPAVR